MQKENEKNGGHRNESREFLFGMLYATIYVYVIVWDQNKLKIAL